MKHQKLYRVTVCGIFSKDVLVYGTSENGAFNYVQNICDNTNLITFGDDDTVRLAVVDAIDLEDDGCDHDCDNCPAGSCVPTFKGKITPTRKPREYGVIHAPLFSILSHAFREEVPYQQVKTEDATFSIKQLSRHMSNMIAQFNKHRKGI